MRIEKLELDNFRLPGIKTFEFKAGWNHLSMPANSGKSAIIEGIRLALCESTSESYSFFIADGNDRAKITLTVVIGEKKYRLTRVIDRTATSVWEFNSPDGGQLDLTKPKSKAEAIKLIVFADAPEAGKRMQYPVFEEVYRQFIAYGFGDADRMKFAGPAAMSWPEKNEMERLSRAFEQAVNLASEKVYILKSSRQGVDHELKQIELKKNQLLDLESQLKGERELLQVLTARIAQNQQTLQHHERIHAFIAEKRSEIQTIEYELVTYKKITSTQTITEISEDEYRDLEKKARQFEALSKKIDTIREDQIHKRHLEKNLEGIVQEIQSLYAEADHSARAVRKKAYDSEARRITLVLSKFKDSDNELAPLERDRESLKESYHKFSVLKKTRELLSTNNLKKINVSVEKLEKQRSFLQKELEQMFADQHEKKFLQDQTTLQQDRQQFSDLHSRLERISTKAEKLRSEISELQKSLEDKINLADQKKRETDVKRHVLFIRDAVLAYAESAVLVKINKINEGLAPSIEKFPLRDQLSQLLESFFEGKSVQSGRYSKTEWCALTIVFTLVANRYLTGLGLAVLDDHSFDGMAEDLRDGVFDVIQKIGLEQVISFKPA